MSDSTSSKSATGTLKQSLLDFRDQMSVYAGHSWPENGLGYGESEPFALREGGPSSAAPGLLGRAPGTRQCINAVDQRRHLDREMEVRARGTINAHFEGARCVCIGLHGRVQLINVYKLHDVLNILEWI